MITIVVVDKQAEGRARIIEELSRLLQVQASDLDLIPRVSIVPLSRQEIKFHAAPDLCVVGPDILEHELTELASIRKIFPACTLIARLRSGGEDLQLIEQLARLGVDEVLSDRTTPQEFLKKLIFLSRRSPQAKTGTLIVVDGGKGGVGVTSVAAGLGDSLARLGKRTALIDFDFDTQDLSRFLQARPFINENLQLLFDQSRPVTEEFVEQCLVPVWEDEPLLRCMPPVAESETLFDSRSTYPRTLISILEVVDSMHEFAVIDAGAARGSLLRTVYRLADAVVFVGNNDPAGLYASIDRLKHLAGSMAAGSKLLLLMNGVRRAGLSPDNLRGEFVRMLGMPHLECLGATIPFSRAGACWPGSGATMRTLGNEPMRRGFDEILSELGFKERSQRFSKWAELFDLLRALRFRGAPGRAQLERPSGIRLSAPEGRKELPDLQVEERPLALPGVESIENSLDLRDLVGGVQFS